MLNRVLVVSGMVIFVWRIWLLNRIKSGGWADLALLAASLLFVFFGIFRGSQISVADVIIGVIKHFP